MTCRQCGADVPQGAEFCGVCGTAQGRQCPSCGAPADEDAVFCGACGNPLDAGQPETAHAADPQDLDSGRRRRRTALLLAAVVVALVIGGAAAGGILFIDGGGSDGSHYGLAQTAACLDETRRYAALATPSPGTSQVAGSEGSVDVVLAGNTGHVALYFERSDGDAEALLARLRGDLPSGYVFGRRGNVAYYASGPGITDAQLQQEIDRVLECLQEKGEVASQDETGPESAPLGQSEALDDTHRGVTLIVEDIHITQLGFDKCLRIRYAVRNGSDEPVGFTASPYSFGDSGAVAVFSDAVNGDELLRTADPEDFSPYGSCGVENAPGSVELREGEQGTYVTGWRFPSPRVRPIALEITAYPLRLDPDEGDLDYDETRPLRLEVPFHVGASEGSPAAQEYARQLNEICEEFNDLAETLAEPTGMEGVPTFIDRAKPLVDDLLRRAQELEQPAERASQAQQWIALLQQSLGLLDELRSAAEEGNQADFALVLSRAEELDKQIDRFARSIGAFACTED